MSTAVVGSIANVYPDAPAQEIKIEILSDSIETRKYLILWISRVRAKLLRSTHPLLNEDLHQTLGFLEDLDIDNAYLVKKLDIVISNFLEALKTEADSETNRDARKQLFGFYLEAQTWKNVWLHEDASVLRTYFSIPEMNITPKYLDASGVTLPEYPNGHASDSINGHKSEVTVSIGVAMTYENLQEIGTLVELQELFFYRCSKFSEYLHGNKLPHSLTGLSYNFDGILNSQTEITSQNIGAFITHVQTFLEASVARIDSADFMSGVTMDFISELSRFSKRCDVLNHKPLES